ncbi:putative Brix domain protein [Trachipleistophora hominis]|uniref:Putative Brix domain protein n=1 Tax=Trachipleistophora hominis TaxID=72359 RepID=L7JZ09_TRAHO|nr:putative Brix domain protein [Trachipleistophora hominis]
MVENEEHEIKFVVRYGKVSKKTKVLLTSIKRMFEPNTNTKFNETNKFDLKLYKKLAEMYPIDIFIVLKESKSGVHIKICKANEQTSVYLQVIAFDAYSVNGNYKSDALLTFNGFDEDDAFRKLFGKQHFKNVDSVERVINFTKNNELIYVRHYKIIKTEGRCVKIGLKEVGPKIQMKYVKTDESSLGEHW